MLLHLISDVHVQSIDAALLTQEGHAASLPRNVEVLSHVASEGILLHLLQLRQL